MLFLTAADDRFVVFFCFSFQENKTTSKSHIFIWEGERGGGGGGGWWWGMLFATIFRMALQC